MQEMMDIHLVKQHSEEMLREVELDRQAKALRAAGSGRESALVWEMKWYAGRLLKLLRLMRNAG